MRKVFTRKSRLKSDKKSTDLAKSGKSVSRFGLLLTAAVVASAGLFGVSGYYWYQNVLTDPDRVLDGMLDKSLQTTSVYRTVNQANGSNEVNQATYLSFTPETIAQSYTTLREINDLGRTTVNTETLGSEQSDQIRYTGIKVEGAVKRNFDQVLGVWGKREANAERGQATSFLNDSLFVVVPFGNLNPDQRRQLINEIKEVNLYDAKSTKLETKDGRPVITYDIELDPQALVKVLAKYIEVTGVAKSTELDPAAYEGAEKIDIQLEVDVMSRHINEVRFGNSQRTESYGAYNLNRAINRPDKTIGIDELQERLQSVEQPR